MLVKPSDFGNKLSWYTELVDQQTPTGTNDRFTEEAYIILDGVDEKKVHLYVEHDLRCYPKLSNLAEVAIITDSDLSSFNKVGLETMASCKTVDVHQSTLATCTIEARYPNLVSTIIIRYEEPNIDLIKELGNNILSTIDEHIRDSSACGQ